MGDPAGANAPRRLPTSPAESEVPAAEINNYIRKKGEGFKDDCKIKRNS
ncbi:hypothetical protein HHO41_03465 [Bacillus sp. DNRA2]|nr:hypothetical protein [Bacillus sp. DNRA2]NMD69333.1 hypothetical protein [Bacillus sp. DNRA2]